MSREDEFKILVGGYFGIEEMDEYKLKVYVLKEIEEYLRKFVLENPIENYKYEKEAEKIKESLSLKRKLQDSLLVLRKINGPLDLILLIKNKMNELD